MLVGRRWGYVDLAGRFVVVPRFQSAAEFNDGVARVVVWDTARCGNRSYTNEDAPVFVLDGSGVGCEYTNRRFGFINRAGEFLVAPQYLDAGDFSEGLANIRIDDSGGPRWGFIDRTGKAVIAPRFTAVLPFSEGLAAVRVGMADRWGFIDRAGDFAIPAKFPGVAGFSEGLAVASNEGGLQGFIGKRGEFVIAPKFMVAMSFSEGLAVVRPGSNTGLYYIDRKGRKALQLRLWTRWEFRGGLTVAGRRGEQMYVDRKGRTIAPYEVDPQW